MTILIYFLKLIMNVIYCIFKLFPVKKKVIFISRQDNRPSINFNILIKALKKERADIEIVVSCKKLHKNFKGILSYIMHMLKEMYHLATSQVAILDTYSITISNLQHKNKLTVIQMWHAMGSLKKFGYSILNQGEGSKKRIAHVMNMHKNYDYVISSSKTCAPYFAEAFHVPIDKIFINALPVVDRLTDPQYQKEVVHQLREEYPMLKKKKTILYCPTFRKNNKNTQKIRELIDLIDFKKYNLIIKLHPHSRIRINDERVLFERKHTTIKFAFLADYIITDYSAIVFELSLLNKPIFFYTYDYDSYLKKRNFYIDFKKEMPGLIAEDPKEIITSIQKKDYDIKKVQQFRKKYISIPKEGCTNRFIRLIIEHIKK